MSGGFRVVISDLQAASEVFTAESKTLAHGRKLQAAHDNYARTETRLSELCRQLTLAGSGD